MEKFRRKLIYDKTIAQHCEFCFTPQLQKVRLQIWQNKCSMFAKRWVDDEVLDCASFYEKDGDMSEYRIHEYFNFFPNDEYGKCGNGETIKQ